MKFKKTQNRGTRRNEALTFIVDYSQSSTVSHPKQSPTERFGTVFVSDVRIEPAARDGGSLSRRLEYFPRLARSCPLARTIPMPKSSRVRQRLGREGGC